MHETTKFLELFLINLLLGEKNEQNNRDLHINQFTKILKVDIGLILRKNNLSQKTIQHTFQLLNVFGTDSIFGRSEVM